MLVEVSSIDRNLRGSTVATIGVAVPRPPVATPDTTTVDEDGVAVVDVAANDTDPDILLGDVITVLPNLVTGPAHGTAVVEDDVALGRRVVRYQPAAGYCGPDSFTYEISDTTDLRATASVSITVVCVNDPPALTGSDPVTVPEGTTAPVGVGVTDPDSTTFTYSWTPTGGLSDPTAATPTFTPTDNGATGFAVTVCDDGVPQACTTLANAAVVIATNVSPAVTAAADATVRRRSAPDAQPDRQLHRPRHRRHAPRHHHVGRRRRRRSVHGHRRHRRRHPHLRHGRLVHGERLRHRRRRRLDVRRRWA